MVIIAILIATTFTANAQVRTITFTGNTGITGGAGDVTKLNCFDVRWHLDNAPGGAVGATEQFIAEIGPQVCSLITVGANGAFDRDGNVRCENIIGVILPPSLTYLDDYSFYNCGSLEKVTINGNVDDMSAAFTFAYCYNLSAITFTQTTPPTDMYGAFYNAGRDVNEVVVNLPYKAKESVWRDALIAAGLDANKLTIKVARYPNAPRKTTKIKEIRIKQGKVEIKPRE